MLRSNEPRDPRSRGRRLERYASLLATGVVLLATGAVLVACSNAANTSDGSGGDAPSGGSTQGGAGGASASGGTAGVTGGASGAAGTTSISGAAGAASGGVAGTSGASGASAGAGATAGGSAATGGTGALGGDAGASPGGSTGLGGAAGVGAGSGAGGGGGTGQAGTGGQLACPGAAYNAASPPTTLTLTGNLGSHDPAALMVGNTAYLFSTGLIAKTSTNLMSWQAASNPLNPRPAWVAQMVPGATNLWAPDISFFGGSYHLYYAASTLRSNSSCIGHATRAALDSGSWADQGTTICSNIGTTDDWNAIDANVVLDDAGTPWLSFGSFWGGIKLIKLTATGARADTMLLSIAARPNARGALEGPFIFKRCGYYYLFTSWGACCGDPYDYNIRVGRSTAVTGPYVDKAGTQLMQGGGTLLVTGNGTLTAPGHNAILVSGNQTYNLYHALNASHGNASLRVAQLVWDPDGWPVSGGP